MGYCWCPICKHNKRVTNYYIDKKDRLGLRLECNHTRTFQLIFSVYDSKGAKYDKKKV
jgi:hypothetical protein